MKKGKRIGAVIAVAFMLIVFSSCENMFISLFGLNGTKWTGSPDTGVTFTISFGTDTFTMSSNNKGVISTYSGTYTFAGETVTLTYDKYSVAGTLDGGVLILDNITFTQIK